MTTATSTDQAASRSFVMIGFVLSTLLTGAVTLCVGLYNNAYQSTRTERTAQVDKFVQSTQDFDPLVRKFVADEKSGRLSQKTRQAIRDNLLQQHTALGSVRSVASSSALSEIDKYDSVIVRADKAIKGSETPEDSLQFAQAALDLGTNRDDLLKRLRTPPSVTLN